MVTFAFIFGIVFGLAYGIAIATLIMVGIIKKSNDIGDSKGHFEDFSNNLFVIDHEDPMYNIY